MTDYIQTEILRGQLKSKHQTSHILHLLLCIPTYGLWAIVWILVAISNSNKRDAIDRRFDKAVMNDLAKKEGE